MKFRFFFHAAICLCCAIFLSNEALAQQEKKVALIWGNGDYKSEWDPLPECINDASLIEIRPIKD